MLNDRFKGVGGLEIFTRCWRPEGAPPRAVVMIAHGFNAHSGHYSWVAEQFLESGLAVYALDHRGRGKSEGERFFVNDMSEYVADLATYVQRVKSREPDLPLFLLGHSAGGIMACTYALDHPEELTGLICESFAFRVPAPDIVLAVLEGLSHVAPHAHVLKLPNDAFSRDPAVVAALSADPLIAHEIQPTKTVAALVRADKRLEAEFASITVPVLILHGTGDKVTKPEGSQLFFERVGSTDKTLKLYAGHFHDLLNDVGKEIVMADIQQWIGERL